MAINNKDYDSLSVASSTSWWMLKENRHREKGPTTAVMQLFISIYDHYFLLHLY